MKATVADVLVVPEAAKKNADRSTIPANLQMSTVKPLGEQTDGDGLMELSPGCGSLFIWPPHFEICPA